MPARAPDQLLMAPPPAEGIENATLDDIMAAMVEIEQPFFSQIDPAFQAFRRAVKDEQIDLPYPFSFCFPPRWAFQDRHMGSGTWVPWQWKIDRVICVGSASEDIDDLQAEGERYIEPFYALYMANRRLLGTVRNIIFGPPNTDGVMGEFGLNRTKQFGDQFPLIIELNKYFTGL